VARVFIEIGLTFTLFEQASLPTTYLSLTYYLPTTYLLLTYYVPTAHHVLLTMAVLTTHDLLRITPTPPFSTGLARPQQAAVKQL
jgi:hypothetical protein